MSLKWHSHRSLRTFEPIGWPFDGFGHRPHGLNTEHREMTRYHTHRSFVAAGLALALGAGCGDIDLDPMSGEALPPAAEAPADGRVDEGEVLARRSRTIDGRTFTFLKIRTATGEVATRITDDAGRPVDPAVIPRGSTPLVHPAVRAALSRPSSHPAHIASDDTLPVMLGLTAAPTPDAMAESRQGSHTFDDMGRYIATLDGETLTVIDERVLGAERAATTRAARRARIAWRADRWSDLIARHGLDAPALSEAIAEGTPSVVLELTGAEIEAIAAESADLVAAIEPAPKPSNALRAALQDVSIDPVVFANNGRQGGGVGIYMSEEGCNPDGTYADYERLAGSTDGHSLAVAGILRGASPRSFIYCRGGFTLPRASDLDGVGGNEAVLVENHSWGNMPGRFGGQRHGTAEYQLLDRDFDDHVYDDRVSVFVAAGNNGDLAPDHVNSPAKALNVVGVGAYDDSTNTITDWSSWQDGEVGNAKPELSAPGRSLSIPLADDGRLWSGTSFASPIAAAAAADLMGAYGWLQLRPAYIKAFMLAGSTDAIAGGADAVGVGGFDFRSAFFSGTNTWWDGRNDAFDWYDDRDSDPGNGYVDRPFDVDANRTSRVRVALSWATRGSYTHAHRGDAHPIGRDLDLVVYDPDGRRVGGSSSWDNPYEVVDFAPNRSGRYVARINEYANRDAGARLRMGLSINFY